MSSSSRRTVKICFDEQPPRVWYKDQAHEPKFFEITVALKDERGHRVRGIDVPLDMALVYDNGGDVKRQSILKISKDTIPKINKTGIAEMKIRIDSVSKNHDNHDFMVKLSTDRTFAPPGIDITSALSQPITVRSKRNRGKRKKGAIDNESLQAVASWCKFASGFMQDMSRRQICPVCEYVAPNHAQSCKLNVCLKGYSTIKLLLEGKFQDQPAKKQRSQDSMRFPPTPVRFPPADLKRNRSPALALDQIHNYIPRPSSNNADDELFADVPPLLLRAPSLTKREKS